MVMMLEQIAAALEGARIQGDGAVEVSSVVYDSRRAGPGALFAAVIGHKDDGRRFARAAVEAGAVAVMTEEPLDDSLGVPVLLVPAVRPAMALAAAALLGRPAEKMILVGITGTNGKTTTTYLLESILKAAGFAPGVIGTVSVRYGGKVYPSSLTTPEGPDLQARLAEMVDAGVTHAVMEAASHAIDLHRVDGCQYDVGIFTNLTQDHLDYHGTFEEYYRVKRRLFTDYLGGKHLPGGPVALVNMDDEWGRRLVSEIGPNVRTLALNGPADYSVDRVEPGRSGMKGLLRTPDGEIPFTTPLLGDVNLYNVLSAAGAAHCLGVPSDALAEGLARAPQTPGRLERVGANEDYLVLVDYAHTPDALERVLRVARNLSPRRLVTVFGCGGDRDKTKRPLMGRAAGRIADLAVVTSDNPRTEEPAAIIAGVLEGMEGLGLDRYEPGTVGEDYRSGSFLVQPDRREAIRLACRLLRPGDILVIAGKGHEDYQILGREKIHFDDREEAEAALAREGKQ